MLFNKRFDYPVLDRVTNEDGTRFYTCPVTGAQLPSVTTIISATEDKSGLKEWAEFVGEKKAQRARDEGTALGSLVHTHVENYIQGIPRPGGNHLIRQQSARMADQIINHGLKHVDEVWGIEIANYFPGLYAGTTDLVGVYKGKPAIMDHKSAKKMRKEDMIQGYFSQLGAYGLSHDEVYGTKIECGVIFMVSRDLKFEQFVIEGDEFKRHQDLFLSRVEAYLSPKAA